MPDTPQETHDAKVQQAVEFLTSIRDGVFLVELHDGIQTAIEGMSRIQKPSAVAVTLTFTPTSDSAMGVAADTQVKLPKVEAKKQYFFERKNGLPSRRNEAQQEMKFPRPVEGGKAVNE